MKRLLIIPFLFSVAYGQLSQNMTITQLRGLASPATGRIYHTTDAGKEGDWKWNSASTTADNTGTVLKITSITTGRFERIFTGFVDASWFGLAADGSTNDATALNSAATVAGTLGRDLYIPAGTFAVSSTFAPPANIKVYGSGWRTTTLKATGAITAVALQSSNVLQDIKIDGNGLATKGLHLQDGNRINVFRVRVESCNGDGVYVAVVNNSLISEVFSQYNHNNFKIVGALNCTFFNCNGNLADGCPSTYRNILVTTQRNCRFIGGIFERGAPDYQVELQDGQSFGLIDLEVNAATVAAVLISGGTMAVSNVHFTLGGTPAVVSNGGEYDVITNTNWTGSGGQSWVHLFQGNVTFNGRPEIPLFANNFGVNADGWGGSSGGSVSYSATKKAVVVTGATASQGARVDLAGGASPDTGQLVKIRFTIKNISSGHVSLYMSASSPSFRKLIGNFYDGYHEVVYSTVGGEGYGFQITAGESVSKTFDICSFSAEIITTDDNTPSTTIPTQYLTYGDTRQRRAVADAATTIAAADYLVSYTTLTATRAVTLPTASSVAGQHFIIKDEAGTAGTHAITIVGTVNGASNPTAVNANYGSYKFYSNGTAFYTE